MTSNDPERISQIRDTAKYLISGCNRYYFDYIDEFIVAKTASLGCKGSIEFTSKFDNISLISLRLLMLKLMMHLNNNSAIKEFISVLTMEINQSADIDNTSYHNLQFKYENAQRKIKELVGDLATKHDIYVSLQMILEEAQKKIKTLEGKLETIQTTIEK
jgi:hypothetical protein